MRINIDRVYSAPKGYVRIYAALPAKQAVKHAEGLYADGRAVCLVRSSHNMYAVYARY